MTDESTEPSAPPEPVAPIAKGSPPLTVAALDLGSNSFHMIVGRFVGDDLQILDRMREPVRLAASLDADGMLPEEAQERALACLERFGQRLRNVRSQHVRAVGTNTLRRARNGAAFRARARRVFGHRIELISGQEEARLIYAGVAHSHHSEAAHRLAVDIGGGSTEVIVGEGYEVLRAHSLFMGCVNYSQTYFPEGRIDRDSFRAAQTAAALELTAVRSQLREMGWDVAVGASGTVNAIAEILRVNGWSDDPGNRITTAGMKRLRKELTAQGRADSLELPGLKPDRAQVLSGGLAILLALFKTLGIDRMETSSGALREGVLYDLVGRIRHGDVRDRTIRKLVEQYHVDLPQATRVERTALSFVEQLKEVWRLRASSRKLLIWAARLHEVGLAVSYTGYQKHGAYLVRFSDMPGFSADDQQLVATLILGHRRKVTRALFSELGSARDQLARRLCVLLRLAVLLNRSRMALDSVAVGIEARAEGGELVLTFPNGWLALHPLTEADLDRERGYLDAVGVALRIAER